MRKFVLFASMMLAAVCAQAQLRVYENGNVAIQTDGEPLSALAIGTPGHAKRKVQITGENNGLYVSRNGTPTISDNWWTAIDSYTSPQSSSFNIGVRGCSYYNTEQRTARTYGVWGEAGNATSGYNYGVFGKLRNSLSGGAAIYGTIIAGDNGSDTEGRYAGYFNGEVKITGTLYVPVLTTTASLSNASANAVSLSANAQEESVSDKLSQLSAIQYSMGMPVATAAATTDTLSATSLSLTEVQSLEKSHYGLMAAQLQQIYPDLVYEDQHGNPCINYIEMIPLLVESIKELKAEITALQGGGNNGGAIMMSRAAYGATSIEESTAVTIPMLKQNNPNPFTENTAIDYTLPETVQTASIYIYDMNGTQNQQIPLTERGESSVTVSGGMLSAGMYLYSLIADGKVIDTKRMILTK